MKIFLILIAVLAVIAAVFAARRAGIFASGEAGYVSTADLPALIEALAKTGKNASFFAVLIPGVGRAGQQTASLQFSIENNSIGMDWVLLDEANISLEKEFIAFASQERLTLSRGEANKVKYLRARGGEDWAAIATRLLNHLFGSARTSRMALIVDGFEWPGKNPSSSAL